MAHVPHFHCHASTLRTHPFLRVISNQSQTSQHDIITLCSGTSQKRIVKTSTGILHYLDSASAPETREASEGQLVGLGSWWPAASPHRSCSGAAGLVLTTLISDPPGLELASCTGHPSILVLSLGPAWVPCLACSVAHWAEVLCQHVLRCSCGAEG